MSALGPGKARHERARPPGQVVVDRSGALLVADDVGNYGIAGRPGNARGRDDQQIAMKRVPRPSAIPAGKFRATERGTDRHCLRWPFECARARKLRDSEPGATSGIEHVRNRTCRRRATPFSCSSLRTCLSPSTWRIVTAIPQAHRLAPRVHNPPRRLFVGMTRHARSCRRASLWARSGSGEILFRHRSSAIADGVSSRLCSSPARLPALQRARRCPNSRSSCLATKSLRSKQGLRNKRSLPSRRSQTRQNRRLPLRTRPRNRRNRSRPSPSQK